MEISKTIKVTSGTCCQDCASTEGGTDLIPDQRTKAAMLEPWLQVCDYMANWEFRIGLTDFSSEIMVNTESFP